MTGEKIHVIPHPDGGWQVKRDGATRAVGIFKTKEEALAKARSLSGNSDSFIVEHSKEGKVQNVSKSKQVEKDFTNVKIHVTPNPKGGWKVQREGSDKIIGNYDTKAEAMARARVLSGNSDSHVVEHSEKGYIKNVSKSRKTEKPKEEKKTATKKVPAKKAAVKKTTAKKETVKKAPVKKAATKTTAKKTTAKKAAVKKTTAKKETVKKAPVKKAAAKKTVAKKEPAKKTPVKKAAEKPAVKKK